MTEITIANIFDLIWQFFPYAIACLYYILLALISTIFEIFDKILWNPISQLWNSIIDFLSFMQSFFDLTFAWGEGLIIIPCFLVCVTMFGIRLLIGIYYAIKKLIPVIG